MRHRGVFLGIVVAATLVLYPSAAFSQAQLTSTRIPQQVVVNGQLVSGASVTLAGGQVQSFSCPSPQRYSTADGSSQGWACYEHTNGVWLLNALPPALPPQPVPATTTVPTTSSPPTYSPRRSPPPVTYQPSPPVIYGAPPVVIYTQPAPPVVIYRQPPPFFVISGAAIEAARRLSRDFIAYSAYELDRARQSGRRR
jgi:hypothetical protein